LSIQKKKALIDFKKEFLSISTVIYKKKTTQMERRFFTLIWESNLSKDTRRSSSMDGLTKTAKLTVGTFKT